MAALPSYVKMLYEGFSMNRDTAVSRTQMEDGMVKQLQTKSRVLVTRKVVLGFATLADYNSFITFFQTTLHYGADWFTFTDPISSTSATGRFVSKVDNERPLVGLNQWRIDAMIETWSG